MNRFKLALLGLVVLGAVAAGSGSSAGAQTVEPAAFKNVHLWLNPEYDDLLGLNTPSLLVMLEGDIVGVQAPVRVRFLVPSTAQMYSAGSIDSRGEYTGGPPDRNPSSNAGWDEISYELTQSTFKVEYYDPIGETADRLIAYQFLRFYRIDNLTVTVQEPRQSIGFQVNPEGQAATDREGFRIQSYNYANLDVATAVKYDITYKRSSLQPSLAVTPGSSRGLIIGIVAAVVLLGAGGLILMSRSNRRSKPVSRAARRRGRVADKPARGQPAPASFCSQCGRKLDRGVRFCPDCGTAV
jgi:hypothetical protein